MMELVRTSAAVAAARTLLSGWVASGLRHMGLSPGSRSAPLAIAAATLPELTIHVVLDERVAGFVALGLALRSATPVVVACTSGGAVVNLHPAVAEAHAARVPLLVVTADRPAELQDVGAPQTVTQPGAFGPHVRATVDLPAPTPGLPSGWLRTVAARTWAQAKGPVPGPVHVNARYRKPLAAADPTGGVPPMAAEPEWELGAAAAGAAPARVLGGASFGVDPAVVAALAGRIAAWRRGVIVCGPRAGGPEPGPIRHAAMALGRHLGWPVLADPASGCRFEAPDEPPRIVTADTLLRAADPTPDGIVRLGALPTSRAVMEWLARHGADRTILVDPHGDWHDPAHRADLLVVAPVAPLLEALATALPAGDGDWSRRWAVADAAARRALQAPGPADACLGSVATVQALLEAMPAASPLHTASSLAIRNVDAFGVRGQARVYANRGLNGIDGTIATGLGLALASAGQPAAVLCGDLAALHDLGGLAAAALASASLTVVVVDNGGGAIFDELPMAVPDAVRERLFVTPQALDVGRVAEGMGARVRRPQDVAGLRRDLQDGLASPGLTVVVVRVDRRGDALHRRDVLAAAGASGARLLEGDT